MSRTWKKFLSLLLVFAMIASLGVSGFALDDETDQTEEAPAEEPSGSGVELTFEKVDNDIISERLPFAHGNVEKEEPPYADDEIVRVSIVLEGASALDAGYAPASAGAYRDSLKAQQRVMANKISAEALDGAKLDVVWNLTLAGNIISANVEYGKIDAIRNVMGVRDVVLEIRYFPTVEETDDPENIYATEMTGTTEAWNLGYTGAGSTIAIVDTGLDTDHQSFSPVGFQHAIDELNEGRETPIKLMTAEDVAAVWGQLNAASFVDSSVDAYLNAKVPYAVNYVDKGLDVTHDNDDQGEHGSHVAGIAAANKYIPNGDSFDRALETVMTQGQAPDSQLLIMKVFGKGGGAYDSDYMAAIEDAMTLGCDSVNLSLGSSVAGFTTNDTYTQLLNKLTAHGLVWCNSAGNSYSWTHFATGDHGLLADDVNYQTGGSPATYANSLSVASVDNTGATSYTITASDGTMMLYTETSGYGNEALVTLASDEPYTYILVDGPGVDDNNYNNDVFALLGPEIMEGKIGICKRGGSSFFAKANVIAAEGAVAGIIFNNQPGSISMNLTDYAFGIPIVSITQNEGLLLKALGEEKEYNGVTYYEGTLYVDYSPFTAVVGSPTGVMQTMSSFSSWGGNGGLTMKPEITAPGGNIWSVNGLVPGGTAYENMSGTSMASPQVAGLVAVLKQYIRETGLQDKFPGLTERAIAQSLLMSTAIPLRDNYGDYWSVMKQGAGLANINNAITARALIQVVGLPGSAPESAYDSIADGKVKVEVGEVNGGFTTSFTVTNISDEDMSLYLSGEFFTQWVYANYLRTEYIAPVWASISWTVDGTPYRPASLAVDFNGDGVSNGADAQTLLDWCADPETEIYNLEYADLDGDGNIDTADAKIAFEYLNGAAVELPAGETADITASVEYDMSEYDEVNGNYIEGFFFIREGDTNDGALGVEHSIPVFGYNGCFSDASMFDRGSYLEYKYGFGDGETYENEDGEEDYVTYPYMYAELEDSAFAVESFLVSYTGSTGSYEFGGNPLIPDETYMPERNALNSGDMLAGVRYSQIRNAGASRFYVTDKYDRIVRGSLMEGGASYAAYYSQTAGAWQNAYTTIGLNYLPWNAKEGAELTAHYQLALEYYIDSDGNVRWDELGAGSELTIPFVIDNTAPDIVKVYRNTTLAPEPDDFETPPNSASAELNDADPTPDPEEPTPDPEEPTPDPEPATDTLEIITHDNQYVAAVALFTDTGTLLDAKGAVQDTIRGKEVYYSFDLKTLFPDGEVYPYLLVQVYDYAANLSTYKVNFTNELENAKVESVTVSPETVLVIGTNSVRLSVDVRPWGIDEAVEWTSSDETIATVDENGIVTGVTEGFATITATSLLDPTKSGTALVQVKFVDKDLNAFVWDENGEVWAAAFNIKNLPDYTPLNADSLRLPLAAAAYDADGTLYAASLRSNKSSLYTIDTDTWTATEIGTGGIGYFDIACSPNLGDLMVACYGSYLLLVDKTTGGYLGGFDLTDNISSNIVGVTYAFSYMEPEDQVPVDVFFFLDQNGNLYYMGIEPYEGRIYRTGVATYDNLGFSCDMPYYQSLYFDGENFFWSRFNSSTNKVDIIMDDGTGTYSTGSFENDVWPVGGLFEMGIAMGMPLPTGFEMPSREAEAEMGITVPDLFSDEPTPDADLNEAEEPEELEDVPEQPGVIAPVTGGLDFARVNLPGDAETEKVNTEVVVYVTANELSYNGKVVVDFDPTTVTLLDAIPAAQYTGIVDRTEDLGHYVLAWVDLNGIAADEVILTLKFDTESVGTVTLTTYEENERDSDTEGAGLPREELVFLGSASVPEDHEHSYELAHWNWAADYTAAAAVFACPQDGATKTYEAEVKVETKEAGCIEPGLITYTATVEVDGQTYTDVKTVELPASGHEYGEPVWTWSEDFTTATATFTCVRNDDEQILEADVTAETIADADCVNTGLKIHTATVEFEGETYTDEQEQVLQALSHDWDEPTWNWDGLRAATATFVCKRVSDHTETLEATLTNVTNEDNTITVTAAVELGGVTYTDTKTAPISATVYATSMLLGTKFAVRAYIFVSDDLLADSKAYVMINGTKTLISKGNKLTVDGQTAYGFDKDIGAKMFNDKFTIQVFNGAGEEVVLVDKDSNFLPEGYTYSAQDYINKGVNHSNQKFAEMIKALNDLGHYAQLYYKHNTKNVAPLLCDLSSITAESLASYAGKVVTENTDVLTYSGTSMLMGSEMKLRQYYTLAEGVELSTLTFTINGASVKAVVSGDKVYVDSKNIPAKNLNKALSFVVKDQDGNVVFESRYSPFSYAYSSMVNTTDTKLINMCKAMVYYNRTARDYFG